MRRSVLVLPTLLAALGCSTPDIDIDDEASDAFEESSESDTGGDDSSTATATGSPDDTDDDTDDDSDSGGSGCELESCEIGEVCIDDECTAIDELADCTPPALAPLALPSANGQIYAMDLADVDQDGADEILAYIDGVGIGVLDEEWTKFEYLAEPGWSLSIAALDIDGDEVLDLLFNPDDTYVEFWMGDGTGNFAFEGDSFGGGTSMRRVELAPGRAHVFALEGTPIGMGYTANYFRFDAPNPWTQGLSLQTGQEPQPLALDVDHEAALYTEHCDAFVFRVGVDEVVHDIETTEVSIPHQHVVGTCRWTGADFDGDGRDELVAAEMLDYGPHHTLLNVFANETQEGPASFGPRQLSWVSGNYLGAVAGDVDGDGDDELLLLPHDGNDATLIWKDADQPLGCRATLAAIPPDVAGWRPGDIDGDGDEEFALRRHNGALLVLGG